MVEAGLLWYDDDTHKPLALKIAEAAQRYRERVGFEPTTCEMRPELVALKDAADAQMAKEDEKQAQKPQRRSRVTKAPAKAPARVKAAGALPRITLRVTPNTNLLPNCFLVGVEMGETPVRAAVFAADDEDGVDAVVTPASKRAARARTRRTPTHSSGAVQKAQLQPLAPPAATAPEAMKIAKSAKPAKQVRAQALAQPKVQANEPAATPAKTPAKRPARKITEAPTRPISETGTAAIAQPVSAAGTTPASRRLKAPKTQVTLAEAPTGRQRGASTATPSRVKPTARRSTQPAQADLADQAPLVAPATKATSKVAAKPKPVLTSDAALAKEQAPQPTKRAKTASPVKPAAKAPSAPVAAPVNAVVVPAARTARTFSKRGAPEVEQQSSAARAPRTKSVQSVAVPVAGPELVAPAQPQPQPRPRRQPKQQTQPPAQQVQQALPGMEIASPAPGSDKLRRARRIAGQPAARPSARVVRPPAPQPLFTLPEAPSAATDAPARSRARRKQPATTITDATTTAVTADAVPSRRRKSA